MSKITFEDRVKRYSKWTVEELANELAYRDMVEENKLSQDAPATSQKANPNYLDYLQYVDPFDWEPTTAHPPITPPFYTTCTCNFQRSTDC